MAPSVVLLYQAVLALAFVLTVGVGVAVWTRREAQGARSLLVVVAATALWSGATLASTVASTDAGTRFWFTVLWIGVTVAPTGIFVFVLQYTGREHLVTRRSIVALAIVPALAFGLVVTNDLHGLIWADFAAAGENGARVELVPGLAFVGYVLYAYGLLAVATVLVVGLLYPSTTLYRGQAISLIVAIAGPWVANAIYLVGERSLDPTPLGFTLTAVGLGFAVVHYRLGDVVPVARDTVVANITDGIFVLDRNDRVVDVNPRGRALMDAESGAVVGEDVRSVFTDRFVDRYADVTRGSDELALESEGSTRHFAVDVSPLEDRRGRLVGRLFIVRDVTDRRRYQRELERQNEQLDRFAGLVSHDLRNPLSVAMGYLEGLEERHDDPDIEEVERSLDRMERITDDVLTLAREGQSIAERESVPLARIATEAWENVSTADATLAVDVDHDVRTDPSRLVQVFENLYRNAVEHGGEAVAVEVGPLDQPVGDAVVDGPAGFYVADDGPGIPDDELDAVLEAGYSTASDGTGLGLHIVETVVEAHGWQLSAANGDGGGARFEVRYGAGVDPAAEPVAVED